MDIRSRKLWKLVCATLCLSLALSVTGCASHSSDGTSAITTNGSEPQNHLIPADTNEKGGGKILDLIFAGLVYYDTDGTVKNEVAESIDTSDNKTFTVHLKDKQFFSDGSPVVAHSFINAWKAGARQAMIASSNYAMIEGASDDGTGDLTGLHEVDDKTFTITLKSPDSQFVTRLGHQSYYPLPDSAFDSNGDVLSDFGQNPIGNGIYKLASADAWVHNQHIELVKNDKYTGERVAHNDGVTIRFYPQIDSAYQDLLSGNLDVLDTIPASELDKYREDLDGRAVSQPVAWIQLVMIPYSAPHFGNDEEGRLRRAALSYAINRPEVNHAIFSDAMTPASDFTAPVLPGFNKKLPGSEVLSFDETRAQELWAQADAISAFEGKFTIAYNSDDNHQAWVEALCHSYSRILGIDAVGEPVPDFGTLRKQVHSGDISGAFRFAYQAGRPAMVNLLENLYLQGATANDTGYFNQDFEDLIRASYSASSQDEANELVNQAQEILLKDLPAIPLWYQNTQAGWSQAVQNVTVDWHGVPVYWQIERV